MQLKCVAFILKRRILLFTYETYMQAPSPNTAT